MNPQIESKLKQIRLSGMAQALPARLAQAHGGNLTHLEFLELLVADELAVRSDRLFARRLKQAGITEIKEFADFDWSFNPKLPRHRLCDLATARFVRERTNILLVGPPGVGKSHSLAAIAVGAIRAGYRVVLKSVFQLAEDLVEAEATGQRRELVDRLSTIDVLALEDFGMKTLRATAAEDLLDIIMRRHERLPTVITTNRPTEDWAKFLGDVPAATAILDRFLQHVEIVLMQGRSYRLASHIAPGPSEPASLDAVAAPFAPPDPAHPRAQHDPPDPDAARASISRDLGATRPPTRPKTMPRPPAPAPRATRTNPTPERKKRKEPAA
jgi:DNA replication protein DnaC